MSEIFRKRPLFIGNPEEALNSLSRRLQRSFKAQVEDWYDVCRNLSAWENRELIDHPREERLAEHEHFIDQLEQLGRWLEFSAQSGDISEGSTLELIKGTIQDLRDRRALWHGSLNNREREEILRDIFHES
jgi:hypothetical protein